MGKRAAECGECGECATESSAEPVLRAFVRIKNAHTKLAIMSTKPKLRARIMRARGVSKAFSME